MVMDYKTRKTKMTKLPFNIFGQHLVIFGDTYVHIILVIESLNIRCKQNSNK